MTFLYFLNLLHQMPIAIFLKKVFKIATGKRKALLLRGFSTSYCQFLSHSLLRGRGKKGSLERTFGQQISVDYKVGT